MKKPIRYTVKEYLLDHRWKVIFKPVAEDTHLEICRAEGGAQKKELKFELFCVGTGDPHKSLSLTITNNAFYSTAEYDDLFKLIFKDLTLMLDSPDAFHWATAMR